MRTLLKNGTVVNVFADELFKADVLMQDGVIIGVDDYDDAEADAVEDVAGRFICPGFIDGHIHIESTMLTPVELARTALPHGTVAIVADPHEIANVCGAKGIEYMLAASEGLPMTVYVMLPSCVPSTVFEESGACLTAADLAPCYAHPRVLGLAEVMNYPGVVAGDGEVLAKIADARSRGKIIDGHAPLLTGRALDTYIGTGIRSDHECYSAAEGRERIRKGQWLMIRQGTAARNLPGLIDLFDGPWSHRCLLVTDDVHPEDLLGHGHIDEIIRQAVRLGKSPLVGIRMASLQAAQRFGLSDRGAIAPGYRADVLVLDSLDDVKVRDVYAAGRKVVSGGTAVALTAPQVAADLAKAVQDSFHLDRLTAADFMIHPAGRRCRVIKTVPDQLLTEQWIADIDWDHDGGIDLGRDILEVAVIERHKHTGHRGLGFISGIGMKAGAIASSVSHDAHNIVVIGTNQEDMACAADHILDIGGGFVAVRDGAVLKDVALPIAGLMSPLPAAEVAAQNAALRDCIYQLGVPRGIAPLMTTAFMSLSVIPALKLTTQGLVDVDAQKIVPLCM